MSYATRSLISALAGAVTVAAHGHVTNAVINGVSFQGFDLSMAYGDSIPTNIGWSTSALDNGFVEPAAFGTPDIICHRDAKNAQGFATIAAGDSIYLQWDTWPESHHGPVLDYLASCNGDCSTVDKTTLEFFKIDQVGLVDGSSAPGLYGGDELIANGNGWLVKIPENIAPGQYVLRHEIIALHSAGDNNGAQNYPQCLNLEITGSGTEQPAGVLGTELYTATDEGILFSIYQPLDDYPVPGPAVIAGAGAVEQASSAIDSTGTPTPAGEAPAAPTDAPAATTTAAPEAPAPTAAPTEAPATTAAPTSSSPAAPTSSPDTCALKKRSGKKSRKARRSSKPRHVAPVRA